MRSYLLILFVILSFVANAQSDRIASLPVGTYEIQNTTATTKFSYGDIMLLADNHYRLKNEDIVGDYKFSATAQRILFLSGTLKGAFARTTTNADGLAIVLPLKENEELGIKLADADIWAFYRKR